MPSRVINARFCLGVNTLDKLTAKDFAAALERLCETYEACSLQREDIICELEAKLFELRGEGDPVAISPLP